jgi:hypothetical protein
MALYDTDKNSTDRSSPSPNTVDVVSNDAIKSHQTISTSYSGTGNTLLQRLQMANNELAGYDGSNNKILSITPNKFLYSDGSTNRVLMGVDSAGSEVVKISKAGFDPQTATNDQLIFNSNQDIFKIVEIGYITVPSLNTGTITAGTINFVSSTFTYQYTTYNSANPPAVIIQQLTSSGFYTPISSGSLDLIRFGSTLSYAGMHNFQINNSSVAYYYTINGFLSSGTTSQGYGNTTFKVFVLQETAN